MNEIVDGWSAPQAPSLEDSIEFHKEIVEGNTFFPAVEFAVHFTKDGTGIAQRNLWKGCFIAEELHNISIEEINKLLGPAVKELEKCVREIGKLIVQKDPEHRFYGGEERIVKHFNKEED